MKKLLVIGIIASVLVTGTHPVRAVIFYASSSPAYNTTAPSGSLAGSGWQYEGAWSAFLGTPIAPNYFITAKHVGGVVGQSFTYGGVAYNTVAQYASPNTDLQIWKVDGTFSDYAPLYTGSDELNKNLVVFGRGTQRGADVTVDSQLKGWTWGSADHLQRWGENQVSQIGDFNAGLGSLLRAAFNPIGGNEASLSTGDSGGAVFIQEGSTWKLAGINYGVDSPYKYNATDANSFNASLFDQSGLYHEAGAGNWQLVTSADPGGFYASRISANLDWINSVIVPEPVEWMALAAGSLVLFGAGRRWRVSRRSL